MITGYWLGLLVTGYSLGLLGTAYWLLVWVKVRYMIRVRVSIRG